MKRLYYMVLLLLTAFILPFHSQAQKQELQQLALDIEKLSQLRTMLADMQTAYRMLMKGYEQVKGVTEGNFSLHQVFLSSLLLVNPAIKKYKKVTDIIAGQARIVKEYKTAFAGFKTSSLFNPDEITYMGGVYNNLFKQTLQNLDELTLVLTAGNLRMTDEERLQAIDRLYTDTYDRLGFLRTFNNKADNILRQRMVLDMQGKTLHKIFGQNK